MIPDLVGKRVVLTPMRVEEAELLAKWLSEPANQPHWFGRAADRGDIGKQWGSEYFDDAYPQRGRAFVVRLDRAPVGVALHGPVFGQPRMALVELVLAEAADAGIGSDAVRTLTQYLFDALLVRKAWAEVAPGDERAVTSFLGAEYEGAGRTAEEGRLVLQRERPATRDPGQRRRATSTKPK